MAKSTGIVIGVLLLIIIVLAGFLIYAFAVRPAVTGYVAEKQMQGIEFAVITIAEQAKTCQLVPLLYGNETINMVWAECFDLNCLRQPSQTQPPQ